MVSLKAGSGSIIWYRHFQDNLPVPTKVSMHIPCDSAILLLIATLENTWVHEETQSRMFIKTLVTVGKNPANILDIDYQRKLPHVVI